LFRIPTPIADFQMRVITVAAGQPINDSTWDTTSKGAMQAINDAREDMLFLSKDVYHRRCDNPSKAVGASFGGGQKVPPYHPLILPILITSSGSRNACTVCY